METIDAKELRAKIDSDEDFVLVDVLSPDSYAKMHLPGAINIPGEDIESTASSLLDKDQEIVVYCASATCQASPTAGRALERMGYTNVTDFEDGLEGWERAGYMFESGS